MTDYIKQLEEQNEELQRMLAKEQSDNELMKVDNEIFTTMVWREYSAPLNCSRDSAVGDCINKIVVGDYVWCSHMHMFDVANIFYNESRQARNIHYYSRAIWEDVIDFGTPERAKAHVEKKFYDMMENLRESTRRA
jgi:hypothetical protein